LLHCGRISFYAQKASELLVNLARFLIGLIWSLAPSAAPISLLFAKIVKKRCGANRQTISAIIIRQ
jgi:hypothetical protein